MGVRCTLLGHRYGEAEIEREREERGEEAVVTIREVKTCSRCGDRSIVSENKEVTAAGSANAEVATPDDADAAPSSEPRPTDPDSDDPVAEESVGTGSIDGANLDAGPEGSDAAEESAAAAGDAAADDAAEGPEHDPETDDGVILDDDSDEPEPEEREYGEWPDADEDHASAEADPAAADETPEPWPDSDEDADEGYDATTPDGDPADVEYPGAADAEPTEASAPAGAEGSADGAEGSAGEEPADVTEPTGDAELLDAGDEPASQGVDDGTEAQPADEGAEFERARESGSPSAPSTGGTELYCPACGYRDPRRDGSLREGDICPECRKGYLAADE
ncbi:hypothetical protein GCM10028857_18250 [Salinarchaeum chitinilyticum]